MMSPFVVSAESVFMIIMRPLPFLRDYGWQGASIQFAGDEMTLKAMKRKKWGVDGNWLVSIRKW
jgi:hypothetical protein